MPAKTIEFDVPYTVDCPICAKAGNKAVPLGLVLSEGIICASGAHKFDSLPGGEGVAPQKAQQPQESSPSAKAGLNIGISGMNPKIYGDTPGKGPSPAETRDRAIEADQDQKREAARRGLQNPMTIQQLAQENGIDLQAVPVAGGDLLVSLVIPERHIGFVTQEAENQRQSLQVYLQEWIVRMLDNQWT